MGSAELGVLNNCQSRSVSELVKLTIKLLNEADDAGNKMEEERRYREVKTLEQAASWSTPNSAVGALFHLMLANGEVSTLPGPGSRGHEDSHLLVERNLYAVRAYLLRQITEDERAGLAPLASYYMVDSVSDVNPLLDTGHLNHATNGAGAHSPQA